MKYKINNTATQISRDRNHIKVKLYLKAICSKQHTRKVSIQNYQFAIYSHFILVT